jgi:hypothetical protein
MYAARSAAASVYTIVGTCTDVWTVELAFIKALLYGALLVSHACCYVQRLLHSITHAPVHTFWGSLWRFRNAAYTYVIVLLCTVLQSLDMACHLLEVCCICRAAQMVS